MKDLRQIRCFILDMDGTFYLGERVLPASLPFMEYLSATGRDYLFLTNNSSRSAGYYSKKLARMGWPAPPEKILTSGEAAAVCLKRRSPGARVFLLGTPDLEAEFTGHGFVLTGDSPDCVVLGFDMTLTYAKLAAACDLIRAGVPYIATHPDINCPTETGYIPDCGAMAALIKASTGRDPDLIVGKPNREIIDAAFAKTGRPAGELAIVGDRLYTDIATGRAAGIASVLVLTGETGETDLPGAAVRPDFVFDDLGALGRALREADANREMR